MTNSDATLILEDGTVFPGQHIGAPVSRAGEVVFNTGMVGYPEAMTDPSYFGQILVLTYPSIGNYGVSQGSKTTSPEFHTMQSERIQISGLVIATLSQEYSHRSAGMSLDEWMKQNGVPGICNVDTRALTKKLRAHGCMLGKLLFDTNDVSWSDPNQQNLVAQVSVARPQIPTDGDDPRIILVDLGCKESIVKQLTARGLGVRRVPWNYDWSDEPAAAVVISNGPGDPKMCREPIEILRRAARRNLPMLGICLGHQLIALAAGADTYKLKYGHRGQNQPCVEVGTRRCFVTSQNHGFAVDEKTLPPEWEPWFFNANDGTNEGIRHRTLPIFSVQFHPEANPGPMDTTFVLDRFASMAQHER